MISVRRGRVTREHWTANHDAKPATRATPMDRARILRDALLIVTPLVYILGYLSWAVHAAWNKLGLLPAVDAQYFVAGILPVLILGVGAWLGALVWRFSLWSATNPSERRLKWSRGIFFVGLALIVVGFGIAKPLENTKLGPWAEIVGMSGAYIFMAGALLGGAAEGADKFLRLYSLGVVWLIVLFIPVLMLIFYVERVFPTLPQEVGGPKPRCVTLDISAQDISTDTRAILFGQNSSPDTKERVRRSKPAMLVFENSEFVLLWVGGSKLQDVYRLAKKHIVVLAPCPKDTSTT